MTSSRKIQFEKVKLKVKLKPFVRKVKNTHGIAFPLPDKLIDSISDEDIKTAIKFLSEMGLRCVEGYWEVK